MRGWSPEEDEMLLQLIEGSGKRWKLIAEALGAANPGNPRTPAMVRNRYLRIERGRWLTEQGMSKNRCGQCGELKRGHVCKGPVADKGAFGSQEGRQSASRRSQQDDGSMPDSPFGSSEGGYPTPGKLSLGAPPLDYLGLQGSSDDMSMSDGGLESLPPHLSGTPGRTPKSLAGMLAGGGAITAGTAGGLPGLRPQSSFDMLLKASEMRAGADQQPKILADTPSVLPGDFPFRSVASENPEPSTLSREDMALGTAPCGTPAQSVQPPTLAENLPHANRRVEVEG